MNVISWENGDTEITDYPDCSDRVLAEMVQHVNDLLADPITDLLSAEDSMTVLDLGHATVGTRVWFGTMERYDLHMRECLERAVFSRLTSDERARLQYRMHMTVLVPCARDAHQILTAAAETRLLPSTYAPRMYKPREYIEFQAELTRDFIAVFKELAGITSPTPDPEATVCAYRKMRQTADA
jgi:hypothetical protein